MARKLTSSSNRNKGGALATRGGAVTPPRRGSRVQPVNVKDLGNTKPNQVGGGSPRPSLPPGQRGGAVATRSGAARPAATPNASTGMPFQAADGRNIPVDKNGWPKGTSKWSEPKGAAKPPTTAKPPTPAVKPPTAAALRNAGALGRAAGAIGAAGAIPGQVMDVVGGFQRLANHPFITKMGKGEAPKGDNRTNRPGGSRGGTTSDATPTRQGPPVPARLRNAPTPPVLPAAVTRASGGGSSSTPSRGGSTPSRGGSTSPARKASAAPTPPSERRVSASTANRESGNYGTSKTNNPLMKDFVARMKDREDKAQSSSASKLTNKFNTNDNFSGEKVDGSKVDFKAKMSSTTSEYDKKKRRYGG